MVLIDQTSPGCDYEHLNVTDDHVFPFVKFTSILCRIAAVICTESPPPKQYTLFCIASFSHVSLFFFFLFVCVCVFGGGVPSCELACVCVCERDRW